MITNRDSEIEEGGNQFSNSLSKSATNSDVDMDETMVSTGHAGKSKVVNYSHLSKIWRINTKAVERTLYITTQNSKCPTNTTISRNYISNGWMLCYKRIQE